jgi:WD40 repeat protein
MNEHRSTVVPHFAEMNCFVVKENFMYGASGDAFGCYKWDLATGQIAATFHHMYYVPTPIGVSRGASTSENYYHAVELVPGTMLLLTGGEDGILGIWNTDTNQLVDIMNLNPLVSQCVVSQDTSGHQRANNNADVCWISCCIARDEQWWIIAGGLHIRDCGFGGYVATVNRSTGPFAPSP